MGRAAAGAPDDMQNVDEPVLKIILEYICMDSQTTVQLKMIAHTTLRRLTQIFRSLTPLDRRIERCLTARSQAITFVRRAKPQAIEYADDLIISAVPVPGMGPLLLSVHMVLTMDSDIMMLQPWSDLRQIYNMLHTVHVAPAVYVLVDAMLSLLSSALQTMERQRHTYERQRHYHQTLRIRAVEMLRCGHAAIVAFTQLDSNELMGRRLYRRFRLNADSDYLLLLSNQITVPTDFSQRSATTTISVAADLE